MTARVRFNTRTSPGSKDRGFRSEPAHGTRRRHEEANVLADVRVTEEAERAQLELALEAVQL